jgi:hypothetical protein
MEIARFLRPKRPENQNTAIRKFTEVETTNIIGVHHAQHKILSPSSFYLCVPLSE